MSRERALRVKDVPEPVRLILIGAWIALRRSFLAAGCVVVLLGLVAGLTPEAATAMALAAGIAVIAIRAEGSRRWWRTQGAYEEHVGYLITRTAVGHRMLPLLMRRYGSKLEQRGNQDGPP